ncbi:hypothetical protein B0H14DRAFT_3565050, partial [Mycena olivaceomarginata]
MQLLHHPDRRPPRLRPRVPPLLRPPRPPLPQTTDYTPFLRPLVLPTLTDLELRPLGPASSPNAPGRSPPTSGSSRAPLRPPPTRHPALHHRPRGPRRHPARHASLTQFHLYLWAGSHTAPQAEWGGVLHTLLFALEELTFSTCAGGARGARRGRAGRCLCNLQHGVQWLKFDRGFILNEFSKSPTECVILSLSAINASVHLNIPLLLQTHHSFAGDILGFILPKRGGGSALSAKHQPCSTCYFTWQFPLSTDAATRRRGSLYGFPVVIENDLKSSKGPYNILLWVWSKGRHPRSASAILQQVPGCVVLFERVPEVGLARTQTDLWSSRH